jgi:hypothetical protein
MLTQPNENIQSLGYRDRDYDKSIGIIDSYLTNLLLFLLLRPAVYL